MFRILNNVKIKSPGVLIAVLLTATGAVAAATTLFTITEVRDIEKVWERFEQGPAAKFHTLNELRAAIGYGGMIHEFKNFVLRMDPPRVAKIEAKIRETREALTAYEALGVNEKERAALREVARVIARYTDALAVAERMARAGRTAGEIDEAVEIDDRPALDAMAVLEAEHHSARQAGSAAVGRSVASVSFFMNAATGVVGVLLFALVVVLIDRRRAGAALQTAHDDLELRVHERTAELQEANEALRDEIAERKRAEEALKESEASLRGIMENAADGIITIDERGIIDSFNPAAERMFDHTADELVGQNVKTLMGEPDRNSHDGYVRNYLRTGRGKIIGSGPREVVAQRKDGTTFPMDLAVSDMFFGDKRVFIGIVRDISERKRAEEALRETSEKLSKVADEQRLLLEHTRDFLYRHDARGVFTYVSPAAEHITGYSVEGWKSHYSKYYTDNPINKKAIEYTEDTVRTGREHPPYLIEVFHKDKRRIVLEVKERPYFEDGKVAGIIGVARDVTEREQAHQALKESEERLRNLAANIPGIVFQRLLKSDGTIHFPYMSAGVRDMYGLEPEDIVADSSVFLKLTPPEDAERYMAALSESASTLTLMDFEFRATGPNGQTKWLRSVSHPRRLENGDVLWDCVELDITEQKRTEEAFKESEARYRDLFEQSPFGIWELDYSAVKRIIDRLRRRGVRDFERYFRDHPDTVRQATEAVKTLNANQAAVKMYRARTKDSLLTTLTSRERSALWEPTFREKLVALAEGTNPFTHKFPTKTFDGRDIVMRSIIRIPESHRDTWSKVIATAEDVTEQTRAEDGLKESEARYRDLVEGSIQGIAIDQNGKALFANQAYAGIFGYENPREILRLGSFEPLCAPHELSRMTRYSRVRVGGKTAPSHYEFQGVKKDGSVIWVDNKVRVVDWGGKPAVQATIFDITEQKRAEEALRLTQFSIDHASDGAFWLNRDGRVAYANDTTCNMLGYSREQLLTLSIPDIDPDASLEYFARALTRIKACGSSVFEARYRTRDGGIIPVEVTIHYLKYGDKELMACYTRDITKRKHAEAEAQRHQAELAHVSRLSTMGEMATALAHELNQPLAAVVNYSGGCLQRLQSGNWTPREFANALERACEEAERASEIVRRIGDFVRRAEPKTTSVSVDGIVLAVVPLVEADAHENRVTVRFDLAEGLPPVTADMIEIEQVILNLARNGIEAMNRTEAGERKLLIQTSMVETDVVEVAISDIGSGLSAEIVDRVFEPFFTTKPSGMGMGLAISRSIIEAHGGRLWASPNGDRGTTFRFTLPINRRDHSDGL